MLLMAVPIPPDRSNGYEAAAERFMSARNPRIGAVTVRRWSQILSSRCSVLDLGCGHDVPVSQTLIAQGFTIYGWMHQGSWWRHFAIDSLMLPRNARPLRAQSSLVAHLMA